MTIQVGHRFIADELRADGHRVSERQVRRLRSQQQLFSAIVKRGWTKNQKPGPPVCDDLVRRA